MSTSTSTGSPPAGTTQPTTTTTVDATGTEDAGPPSYPLTADPVADLTGSGMAGPDQELRLKATGPGGVTYVLRIPAGAFGLPVEVSMTPLSNVAGFGDGIEAAGVRLEPSGLTLAVPGTLTVTGGAADSPDVLPWTAEDGEAARLGWLDPNSTHVEVEVDHFSDVVVTAQPPPHWARTVPLDNLVSAEYQTVIATLEYVVSATATDLIRGGDLNQPDLVHIMNTAADFLDLYVDALASHLETLASAQSVAGLQALERDLVTMLSIERHLQLMGYDAPGLAQEAILRLAKKIAAALKRFCVEHSSPEAAVTILGILRSYQLAGGLDENAMAQMQDAVDACLRVRVDIDIETRSCFPSTHADCSPWRHDRARFLTSLLGPPLSVPFHGGTMTLERVTLTMSKDAKPTPPLRVPRPDGAEVLLTVVAPGFADFYGSYENGEGGTTYWEDNDPRRLVYRRPWTIGNGGKSLALLALNQYGGNGAESNIVIEVFHDPLR